MKASDLFVKCLETEGVTKIFGIPGEENADLMISLKKSKIESKKIEKHLQKLQEKYNISKHEAEYFVFKGEVSNLAYQSDIENINILHKNGKVADVIKASDQLNLEALSEPVVKYYICYPKPKD